MEPRNYTVNDIFDGNQVYVVPRYQRLYVWNREDQWRPLWEDVKSITETLLGSADNHSDGKLNSDAAESHFFGTVVLKTSGHTPDLSRKWRVIDGQQRLTTMQLMMSAVADELECCGLHESAKPLRRLTSNNPESESFSASDLKITHGSNHYEGFVHCMNPHSDKSQIIGPMALCYGFFRDATKEWLDNPIDIQATALVAAIVVKLRVVAIYLDPHEQEHKIFESLNARGEPLTEWDKIKNFLLHQADRDNLTDPDDFFDEYLDAFDEGWWREDVGRGIGRRPRSDLFADYWLESKISRPVGARRVYREFENYVNRRSDELSTVGDEFTEDALYFKEYERVAIYQPSVERRFHNRRLRIGVGAWWPMILGLNQEFKSLQCDEDVRSACFDILESFLFRRLIVGHQARSYDNIGFEILEAVRKGKEKHRDPAASLVGHLLSYGQSGNLWPDDYAVRNAVKTRRLPRYAHKLVLEAIEFSLIGPHAGQQNLFVNLEVEHLMPQGWSSGEWPLASDQENASSLRHEMVHMLGNLTLINGGLNRRMSNRSWQDKRKLIKKSDNLFINKQLLDTASGGWDEEDIEQRGQWMADQICLIWPRPSSEE